MVGMEDAHTAVGYAKTVRDRWHGANENWIAFGVDIGEMIFVGSRSSQAKHIGARPVCSMNN